MGSEALLIEAIQAGDAAQAVALLESEPELAAARVPNGPTAALLAQYYGHPNLARELIARGAEVDIFTAAGCGLVDELDRQLDADPGSVNAFSADGFQPLGLAAYFGQTQAAMLLLDRGAEVNTTARNPMAVTPLHSAAAGRRAGVVKLLLAHGANPNVLQSTGFTPLHSAAQNGDLYTARLLLAAGVDVNARSQDGSTPLVLARKQDAAEVIVLLQAYGAEE